MDDTPNQVILIPAYEPDEKLLKLLLELSKRYKRIVLVNDGSSQRCNAIFEAAREYVEKIIVHENNRGKGAALKSGFNYIGNADVITADADGQHTPDDIDKVAAALKTHRNGLVLGVRAFSGKVPLRSRFGNFWTRVFFFLMTGLWLKDTQSGLRGIPAELVPRIAAISGMRYEYEMAMLSDAKNHEAKPLEIPIETIYIEENKSSHFNPLLDTIRIYGSLIQFCLSSVLSFILDNAFFAALVWILSGGDMTRKTYTFIALVVARFISSHFNYFYNRFVVFKKQRCGSGKHRSYIDYFALVLLIAALSYGFTQLTSALFDVRGVAIAPIKIVVDTVLFIASYRVQKQFVFRRRSKV